MKLPKSIFLLAGAALLWMVDNYALSVSCDSKRPLTDVTMSDPKRAGVRHLYWRENVQWWKDSLATMRSSTFYREPQRLHRQMGLFDLASHSAARQ